MTKRGITSNAGVDGITGNEPERPADSQAEGVPFLELSPLEALKELPHLPWLPWFLYAGGGAVLAFSVSWFWYPTITHELLRGHMDHLIRAIVSGEGILTGVLPGSVGTGAMLRARMLMRRRAAERAVGAGSREDAETTAQLAALGTLPEEIAGPLGRAVAAYRAMVELAADPGWRRARVPMRRHVDTARSQLLVLLDRARRLLRVQGALQQQEGSAALPVLDEVGLLFEAHREKLASAAAGFEQAQVSMARALLALTDRPGVAPQAPLHDMAASLSSLAEVLESLGHPPAAPQPAGAGPVRENERPMPSGLRW